MPITIPLGFFLIAPLAFVCCTATSLHEPGEAPQSTTTSPGLIMFALWFMSSNLNALRQLIEKKSIEIKFFDLNKIKIYIPIILLFGQFYEWIGQLTCQPSSTAATFGIFRCDLCEIPTTRMNFSAYNHRLFFIKSSGH